MTDPRDTMRWVWRGVALAALLIGWLFIAWQNKFHITAPLVFVCLGYLAVIATVYNLWRTGAVAVDAAEDGSDSTWAKPAGAMGELEREKRTLLKAIKEAEFDHQMGKLSQRDADEMIRSYRARAIEVIKEIDRLGLGTAGSVREQILREVRARVQLEGKAPKKSADAKAAKADAGKRAAAAKAAKDAVEKAEAEKAGAAKHAASKPDAEKTEAEKAEAEKANAEAEKVAAAAAAEASLDAAPEVTRPLDEELDADSTAALEPRHDDAAKEATP